MSTLSIVLLVILVVLIIACVVLYFLGKKAEKKQAEQQEQLDAVAQTVSMLAKAGRLSPTAHGPAQLRCKEAQITAHGKHIGNTPARTTLIQAKAAASARAAILEWYAQSLAVLARPAYQGCLIARKAQHRLRDIPTRKA